MDGRIRLSNRYGSLPRWQVLLVPAELSELQSRSVANIRWFLGWERRGLERQLGDFLMDKLAALKAAFCSKAGALADRWGDCSSDT